MIPGVCTPTCLSPAPRLVLLLAFVLAVFPASFQAHAQMQAQPTSPASLSERIAQDRESILSAERQQLPNAHQGYLWALLAGDYRDAADFMQSESAYNRAIQLLKDVPEAKVNYATALDNLGALYQIYAHTDEALNYLRKALAIRQELGDRFYIAMSLEHLADVDVARRRFKDAERESSQAYQILVAEGFSNGDWAPKALITLAFARCMQNNCAEGVQDGEHALAIARTAFDPGSLRFGLMLMGVGFVEWKSGHTQEAEKAMLPGLQIVKNQTAPGDPLLVDSMIEYRNYLVAMHRKPEAKHIDAQLATLQHPCPDCSVSVYSLSNAMR
jgi:tetratricopeptide (TPR) repeat protein